MAISSYLKIGFGLIILGLSAVSFAFIQPNVGLRNALFGGVWSVIAMQAVMTAAVYGVLLAPAVFLGTRRAFGFSVLLICLVAFGPRTAAELSIMQQRAKVQDHDRPAIAFEGNVQVVDFYEIACQELCKTLLSHRHVDAVRTLNQYDVTEVFAWNDDPSPSQVHVVKDVFEPGDLTIAIDRADPYHLRQDWDIDASGFARPEMGSRFTITQGGAEERTTAPALFRETVLSHSLPVVPTRFQPVLRGWTSGGNRGGVEFVRFKRWNAVHTDKNILAVLSVVGLDLTDVAELAD